MVGWVVGWLIADEVVVLEAPVDFACGRGCTSVVVDIGTGAVARTRPSVAFDGSTALAWAVGVSVGTAALPASRGAAFLARGGGISGRAGAALVFVFIICDVD